MEFCAMKEEQAKRLKKFSNRDKKTWKRVLENCTMCGSELVCFDVYCAMLAVGNATRMEGIKDVPKKD